MINCINKTSTINNETKHTTPSFKSTFVIGDFYEKLSPKSTEKLNYAMKNISMLFPQNDVFFYKKMDNNICYKIQKAHPMKILLHPAVLPCFESVEKIVNLVNCSLMFDMANKKTHGSKEVAYDGCIENINDKEQGDVLNQILKDIVNFNNENRKKEDMN